MFDRQSLERLLEQLGEKLSSPVTAYLIGGCNMSVRGLKEVTKDIDLVLGSRKEFNLLKPAMEELGYRADAELMQFAVYKDAVIVFLDASGSRIDLFIDTICQMLRLSASMKKRSMLHKAYGKLQVMLTSKEDIFLFKSLTERPQDVDDCLSLLSGGLDWDVIIDECVSQHRKDVKWIFWLFEHVCRLERKEGAELPAHARIFDVCAQHWEQRPGDFMGEFSDEEQRKYIPAAYFTQLRKKQG